jgi:hypothetical protein
MSGAKMRRLVGVELLGVLVLLGMGGLAACGDSFNSDDCQATRTCTVGDEAGGAAGEPGASEPGAGGRAGSNAGTGGQAGDGGMLTIGAAGSGAACTPEGCDDADPSNGQETCGEEAECLPGNPPPVVIAISPADATSGVEPDSDIIITFSEPLDAETVTLESIRVLDGEQVVSGTLTQDADTVTFTADLPFALLAEYSVSVDTSVKDLDGASLLEAYASAFSVRDGEWREPVLVTDNAWSFSDTLPITEAGDVLVAWAAMDPPTSYTRPVGVNWFHQGQPLSPTPTFLTDLEAYCDGVTASANAAGVAVVSWDEGGEEAAQQFRSGGWPESSKRAFALASMRSSAVAPDGRVSIFLTSNDGTDVWLTNSTGQWAGTPSRLSDLPGLSAPRVAFDPEGNGMAVWKATSASSRQEILVTRFLAGTGQWLPAEPLFGSTAGQTGSNFERGVPAVALDEEGGAMVLWVREDGAGSGALMASRFLDGIWEEPAPISGAQLVTELSRSPGLVFDGETYVAAWNGSQRMYASRFDRELGEFSPADARSAALDHTRMPELATDAHGNLLLVWLKNLSASPKPLLYARYAAQAGIWQAEAPIPAQIVDAAMVAPGFTPLGVNARGVGALMWGDIDSIGDVSAVRLISFH